MSTNTKVYKNYVVYLSNDLVKVGMTANLAQRMGHYKRMAKSSGAEFMVWFACRGFEEKKTSLLMERLICNSYKHLTEYGKREWLLGNSSCFSEVIKQCEYVRKLFGENEETDTPKYGFWNENGLERLA